MRLAIFSLSVGALVGLAGLMSGDIVFLYLNLACIGVMGGISLFGIQRNRAERRRFWQARAGMGDLQERLSSLDLETPSPLWDIATLLPSWVGLWCSAALLVGAAMVDFPGLRQALSVDHEWWIWPVLMVNLFLLPYFWSRTVSGSFSWPVGGVVQRRYYPLLVLRRDVDRDTRHA